jgi:argininosuccinate synthase
LDLQYEGRYLLGTSLARPVIARGLMRVSHRGLRLRGAWLQCVICSTFASSQLIGSLAGKGNDQQRLELAFYAIQPSIKIIAPWRESRFFSRFRGWADLISYAAETGIPVTSTKAKPWSMDANLAHCRRHPMTCGS